MTSFTWIVGTMSDMRAFCLVNGLESTASALRDVIEICEIELSENPGKASWPETGAADPATGNASRTCNVVTLFPGQKNPADFGWDDN